MLRDKKEPEEDEEKEQQDDEEEEEELEHKGGEVDGTNFLKFSNVKNCKWKTGVKFQEMKSLWKDVTPLPLLELPSPIDYFYRYIPPEIIKELSEKTNMYILQNNKNVKHVTEEEISTLIGLHLAMGALKFPRARMYWDRFLNVDLFQHMLQDRFFQIRNNVHIVNNLEVPVDNTDRFYKVRPIYNCIQRYCQSLEKEECLCVDEQMIPFVGRLNVKQYVKGKPNPWGIKVFMLCGKSGLVHDFLLYQGKTTQIPEQYQKIFGLGGAAVFHLVKDLNPFHQVYFDNYFSSYNLFQALSKKSLYAVGT